MGRILLSTRAVSRFLARRNRGGLECAPARPGLVSRTPSSTLRRQALEHPMGVVSAAVAQAIVKAIVSLLPELEALCSQAKATPIRRQRQVAPAVPRLQVRNAPPERRRAVGPFALPWSVP